MVASRSRGYCAARAARAPGCVAAASPRRTISAARTARSASCGSARMARSTACGGGGQVTVAGTAACATYTWFSLSRGFYTETVCAWSGESLMWSFTPTTSSSTLYDTSRSLLSLY